jgi:hypothetical protein
MSGTSTPSLDLILREPATVAALPRQDLEQLLREAAAVQSTLTAYLPLAESGESSASAPEAENKMLTVEEAAIRLRRSRRWIYRHAKQLPFVKRISARSLLISEHGLQKWLDRRKSL